eukprot:1995520-Rhodomonas_salina.1
MGGASRHGAVRDGGQVDRGEVRGGGDQVHRRRLWGRPCTWRREGNAAAQADGGELADAMQRLREANCEVGGGGGLD